jgi:hypothetical protein
VYHCHRATSECGVWKHQTTVCMATDWLRDEASQSYPSNASQEHARHEAVQRQLQELTFKPVINRSRDVGPVISMLDPGRHLAQVSMNADKSSLNQVVPASLFVDVAETDVDVAETCTLRLHRLPAHLESDRHGLRDAVLTCDNRWQPHRSGVKQRGCSGRCRRRWASQRVVSCLKLMSMIDILSAPPACDKPGGGCRRRNFGHAPSSRTPRSCLPTFRAWQPATGPGSRAAPHSTTGPASRPGVETNE